MSVYLRNKAAEKILGYPVERWFRKADFWIKMKMRTNAQLTYYALSNDLVSPDSNSRKTHAWRLKLVRSVPRASSRNQLSKRRQSELVG